MSLHPAFGYLSAPRAAPLDAEQRLRRTMLEFARAEALDLQHLFVDRREDDAAYGFDALRVVLGRRRDVDTVVLPDLGHVGHIALVAGMSADELGRFLGCQVRLVHPEPSPRPRHTDPPARPLAIGLVYRPSETQASERRWARALVIRLAHESGLQLIDVLELYDEPARTRAVLSRLGELAAAPGVGVLVTDGLDDDLARRLADDLGLAHRAVLRA